MRRRSCQILSTLVLAASAGALLAVASAEVGPPAGTASGAEFQRLVHGLGFGPTLDLSRCDRDFDPRVGNVCPGRHEPIPAGRAYCPHHACSVLFP